MVAGRCVGEGLPAGVKPRLSVILGEVPRRSSEQRGPERPHLKLSVDKIKSTDPSRGAWELQTQPGSHQGPGSCSADR